MPTPVIQVSRDAALMAARSPRLRSWQWSRRSSLAGNEGVDPRAEVLQHEIVVAGRLAVGHILRPLLDRQLDAEFLVDRENGIEKVEAVDAEIAKDVALWFDHLGRDIADFANDPGHSLERRWHR